MSFIDDLTQGLIAKGIVDPSKIQGCTSSEISALMDSQGVSSLPQRYIEFLLRGGKNPYWLSQTGEWDYEWLLEAKELAREIVVEDYERDFTPFAQSFIFQTHQGYMFYYFRQEDLQKADPHFWIYSGYQPVRISDRPFSGWLRQLADYLPVEIAARKRMNLE
ncbi:hypothetical protein [Nocardia donostiensis]|uniref:Knr4/Smi1-like domain-containing protein n=1 Tax=Nocardia donostiensis TaxID=1538463 RepID=A0A1W0AYC8_9NOCA|nr:hypothetical protein [Nocardia donostiensis]ONM47072.1 hypothetical protein B0T46_18970 [Nocardia donostiensis]OQS15257.1 hypothetical protein B0T36_11525 [Nocardia donostiensis]OQS20057.1 hypothetical protein B0T44_10960 [Nocardia donostiensis]